MRTCTPLRRRPGLGPALLLAGLAVVAGGCGGAPVSYPWTELPDPTATEYVIGAADRLRITVWQNANLSKDVTVRPDGTITMPLLGDLRASGKTPTRLNEEITQRLQQYVKEESAEVSVEVVEVNSYRFTVSGEVNQSGVFNSKHYVRVVEAIMLAGGFSRFARRDAIQVVRCCDPEGRQLRIPVSYDAIIKDGRTEMNFYLLAGDEVYVP